MNELREGLYEWLKAAFGTGAVIWADGNGPVPARVFVVLKIISVVREGYPTYHPIDDLGNQAIQQGALLTLHVACFGGSQGEALAESVALSGSLNRTSVKEALREHGLAFVDLPLAPVDVSKVVGTTFEGRAHFDARFRANLGDTDPVGWIATVILDGEYRSGDLVLTTSQTIGVA